MKRKALKKLVLEKNTVRRLTAHDLDVVVGGRVNLSRPTQCKDICQTAQGC